MRGACLSSSRIACGDPGKKSGEGKGAGRAWKGSPSATTCALKFEGELVTILNLTNMKPERASKDLIPTGEIWPLWSGVYVWRRQPVLEAGEKYESVSELTLPLSGL